MEEERGRRSKVRSYSSGTPGRALCNARDQHWVVDGYILDVGPGEAMSAGEAFLSGLSACAVNMVERIAIESRMPLARTEVTVEAVRDYDAAPIHPDFSVYQDVHLFFEFTGIDDDQAHELVHTYERT